MGDTVPVLLVPRYGIRPRAPDDEMCGFAGIVVDAWILGVFESF